MFFAYPGYVCTNFAKEFQWIRKTKHRDGVWVGERVKESEGEGGESKWKKVNFKQKIYCHLIKFNLPIQQKCIIHSCLGCSQ